MKRKITYLIAIIFGLVLLSAHAATACQWEGCEGKVEIIADCECFYLKVEGDAPYSATIDYLLILALESPPSDPATVDIRIKGSFDVDEGYVNKTIRVCWDELSLDGLSIPDFVQSGGTFTLTGVLKGYDTERVIGPVKFGLCGPTTGACCLPDGSCTDDVTIADCTEEGGVYQGNGTSCDSIECPQPPPFCEDGLKPQSLNMTYTGDNCSATNNTQEGKVQCDGDPAGFGPVFIVAASKDNLADSKTKIWFSGGSVGVGDVFVIDATAAGKTKLDADTYVFIYKGPDGDLLQTIKFHTSCSKDLNIGDQFGSLVLEGGFLISK